MSEPDFPHVFHTFSTVENRWNSTFPHTPVRGVEVEKFHPWKESTKMRADPETFPGLPALKSLGDLSTAKPTVVIETREKIPLVFTRLPSVTGTLQSGDYSFAGAEDLFAVERKSIQDLVACCTGKNRERFERELHRLRGFRFARLLIVGHESEVRTGRFRGGVSPKAVLATLNAFEVRYNVPVVWANTPENAALLIEKWTWWLARELVKQTAQLVKSTPGPSAGNGI